MFAGKRYASDVAIFFDASACFGSDFPRLLTTRGFLIIFVLHTPIEFITYAPTFQFIQARCIPIELWRIRSTSIREIVLNRPLKLSCRKFPAHDLRLIQSTATYTTRLAVKLASMPYRFGESPYYALELQNSA